jgi:hypothetical protein
MPTETFAPKENGQTEKASEPVLTEEDEGARNLAHLHRQDVRRFKRWLAVYLISLVVLTPIWIVTQYQTADGWPKHLSSRSRNPGDWDPWIIWVALVGGVLVVMAGLRAYADHADRADEIGREAGARRRTEGR